MPPFLGPWVIASSCYTAHARHRMGNPPSVLWLQRRIGVPGSLQQSRNSGTALLCLHFRLLLRRPLRCTCASAAQQALRKPGKLSEEISAEQHTHAKTEAGSLQGDLMLMEIRAHDLTLLPHGSHSSLLVRSHHCGNRSKFRRTQLLPLLCSLLWASSCSP